LPKYIFRASLRRTTSPDNEADRSYIKLVVEISREGDSEISQTIEGEVTSSFYGRELQDLYDVSDINFDGYADLSIWNPFSGAYNNMYTFYLFDPETGLLDGSSELCEDLNNLINPIIHHESQTIEEISKGTSLRDWTVSVYQIIDGRLALISKEDSDCESYGQDKEAAQESE
jgi:hypothetical protein